MPLARAFTVWNITIEIFFLYKINPRNYIILKTKLTFPMNKLVKTSKISVFLLGRTAFTMWNITLEIFFWGTNPPRLFQNRN